MSKVGSWSTTAGNNNATPPDGWPEGQAPSTINDCAREMMAAIKTALVDIDFFDHGMSPTFVNANSFTVPGDQTARLVAGRQLKLFDGTTIYRTIATASFTVVTTISLEGGTSITTSLSSFGIAVLNPSNTALPDRLSVSAVDVTALSAGTTTITGTLTASGAVTMNSTLTASGAVTLLTTLTVSGATTLKAAVSVGTTLAVGGATTLAGTLTASGAVRMLATLSVSGAASVLGTLTASGAVHAKTTLSVGGATTLGSTLGVTGATTLAGTLTASGAVTLNTTLTVSGAVTLKTTLSVGGAANIGGAVALASTFTASATATFLGVVNLNNYAKSVGNSGYYTLPGGLIVQWGVTASISGGGLATGLTTFPLAFPTRCDSVVISPNVNPGGGSTPSWLETITTSDFTVHNQNANASTFLWVAFGH